MFTFLFHDFVILVAAFGRHIFRAVLRNRNTWVTTVLDRNTWVTVRLSTDLHDVILLFHGPG